MAVFFGTGLRGAVPIRPIPSVRPWRGAGLIVPMLAVLLVTVTAWNGTSVDVPALWTGDLEQTVLSEEPVPPEIVAESAAPMVVEIPPPAVLDSEPSRPQPIVVARPTRPMVAVVGVGVQGLVVRSAPGDGELQSVVDEGMDLNDLGEVREALGRSWRHVRSEDGRDGWVASDFLLPWDGVDRQARMAALFARSAEVATIASRDRSWLEAPPEVRSITPDQLHDSQTLSSWEAFAACAPAATVAFARAIGHDLTLDEAVVAARKVGWGAALGMPGPRAEVALLASLGIEAHQRGESEDTIDWDRVVGDVQAGIPVMVVTVNHYYVAEKYDPETGKLDFGNSAMVLAGAHGKRWFLPSEIGWLGYGTPFTTIHLGKPPAPPSYARMTTAAY
jgi:hypothetical protein